jgi:hypothetical protein
VSKENSLRHLLNILFSEGGSEFGNSDALVCPAASLLLIDNSGRSEEETSNQSEITAQRSDVRANSQA